jgi:hypothetical protein
MFRKRVNIPTISNRAKADPNSSFVSISTATYLWLHASDLPATELFCSLLHYLYLSRVQSQDNSEITLIPPYGNQPDERGQGEKLEECDRRVHQQHLENVPRITDLFSHQYDQP